MKSWIVFAVVLSLLPAVAYADGSVSLYLSASNGYQGMPITASFYYNGYNFNHFVAGWSTTTGVCMTNCQTLYTNSQSSYTTVPYYSGTVYYTVIAYDSNNNVLATLSSPFTVNYPYQSYYSPFQPYYQPYYQTYYQTCTPQYQATYQCLGNDLQQIYQGPNCGTQWVTVQRCNNGCFSPNQNVGYCIGGGVTTGYVSPVTVYQPVSACQAQTTGGTFCAGDFVAQKYQYSDCSTGTQIQQFCPNGCLQGNCLPLYSKSSVELDTSYAVKACDVSELPFAVKNTGDRQSDFMISVSGDAASWIHAPSTVTVDAGQQQIVTALVSVPCDATGSKTFSVTVKGATNNTQNSVITVGEAKSQLSAPATSTIVSFMVLVVIVIGGVVLYRSAWFQNYVKRFGRREQPF